MFREHIEKAVRDAKPADREGVRRMETAKCIVEVMRASSNGGSPSVADMRPDKMMSSNALEKPLSYKNLVMDGKRQREFEVKVSDVRLDPRGFVRIDCSATLAGAPMDISLPVYLVDVPIDEDGDIEDTIEGMLLGLSRMVE